ncbi:hypothetical protein BG011_008987 [Mortierella polycephala]|uniref:protein-tyrosine-phosphatase n=1 Tax=Mortierella polycephala TaxID=41804 RepID=A0A9P6PQ47_9FUNG|nr:hypothetical protein BG011_008987 [Mortierella polycephala]
MCVHIDGKKQQQHSLSLQRQKLQQQQRTESKRSTRTWPRTSHVKDVLAKKNSAPSALDVVSPYNSTTFMLTPPSAYTYNGTLHHYHHSVHNNHYHHHQTSSGKSPSKRFSLQKYYYGRNTMSMNLSSSSNRMTPSRTPSPSPPSLSPVMKPTIAATALAALSASGSQSIPALSLSSSPSLSLTTSTFISDAALLSTIPEATASMLGYQGTSATLSPAKSDTGSLSTLHSHNNNQSSIITPFPQLNTKDTTGLRLLSPPTLTTIMATPTTPSLPSFPSLSCSPPSATDFLSPMDAMPTVESISYPSPCSPSFDSSSFSTLITPEKSNAIPFPASGLSPEKLTQLLMQEQGAIVSAGSRRRQAPLILDLRPNPDFCPISIRDSININLPTLLMKRYRRSNASGAVSNFAIESFITMPGDLEVYHRILDSWRATTVAENEFDVIVLDHDMRPGEEAYGRSATAAWTLLHVLERGGGSGCFGGVSPIRLWYLEGGFEAFQASYAGDKFLVRDAVFQQASQQDVEMTLAAPMATAEAQTSVSKLSVVTPSGLGRKPLLAIDTSVALEPKSTTPVRRESLFSLNTKSLQRPAGVTRAQTGSLKSLSITIPTSNAASSLSINTQQQHPQPKGSWLTVPASTAANAGSALSPAMSMVSNSSMEIAHSASTDHLSSSSTWSADSGSVNGSRLFPCSSSSMTLNSKRSVSSLTTLNSIHGAASMNASSCIQEVDEKECFDRYHGDMYARDFGSNDKRHDDDNEDANEDDGEQEISCILPNFLYLGPEIVRESQVQELGRLGVKRVLNMATECEDLVLRNRPGPEGCADMFEYHKIGVYDHIDADVTAGLLQAVEIIAASPDAPIYVHCKAGKSRSVTATIAYLITQLHWPLNRAYQHVLKQRPCMCPNIGFVAELMRVEERTLGAEKAGGLFQRVAQQQSVV